MSTCADAPSVVKRRNDHVKLELRRLLRLLKQEKGEEERLSITLFEAQEDRKGKSN